ncbi:hypothetical protein JSY14_06495 [Brachybacterium sp. EF45031]|uniref:hypothetical protein n=1 Tax=Brachybacterium sillae TaxID=2810536 RepID=UPI00217EEADB|nr:hypothetical protein [Brachybacterium sillae]MCS6711686.1 hypothetical protein [Brachybacterium sillae]
MANAPAPAAIPATNDDLSGALSWIGAYAKQNKHRLPAEAYVSILESCQVLDAVTEAERREPSGDARLQYELGALVREYFPAVLRGYLAIPAGMVEVRQSNGRTANEELVEQLHLLSGQAEALHSSRHSHMSSQLATTGNFLREKFGRRQQGAFDFGVE